MRALLVLAALLLMQCTALADDAAKAVSDDPLAGHDDPHTLSQLLQWSLANQDLDQLHERAEAMRSGGAVPAAGMDGTAGVGVLSAEGNENDFAEGVASALPTPADVPIRTPAATPLTAARREELAQLSGQLMPDQVTLMREALSLALNESEAEAEREEGILQLQELVEDIDNAKDLKSIGEFATVVGLLESGLASLQAGAAWTLGSAVKNHRELQLHLLEEGGLPTLLRLLTSHAVPAVRMKAVYAISALLGNCPEAQAAFASLDGMRALLAATHDTSSPSLVRKGLVLLTDLLQEGRQDSSVVSSLSVQNHTRLCEAVLLCLRVGNADSHEKAMLALRQLIPAGLTLQPASDAEGGCSVDTMLSELQQVQNSCLQAGADAPPACEVLMPLCEELLGQLHGTMGNFPSKEEL